MKILTNLDLVQNQLLNASFQNLAADPATPVPGQTYYNTTASALKYFNGTAFFTLSNTAGTVTTVTASAPLLSSGGLAPNISLTGIVAVANGGTGAATLAANGILLGNGTAAISSSVLSSGQLLIGSTGLAPVPAVLTGTANRLGIVSVAGAITLNVDVTQFPSSLLANAGLALVATGANAAAYQVLGVIGGGTGAATLGANSILLGNGTAAVSSASLSSGQLLIGSTGLAPVPAVLTGTANRLGIVSVAGAITLNVDVTQFPSATVANTVLVSSAANAALWTIVPIAAGGTGASSLAGYGVLAMNTGGTSVTSTPLTNGQLLIGSTGAAAAAATLTGTINQVNVVTGPSSIVLSLPQNINTAAAPTFAGLFITGPSLSIAGNALLKSESASQLAVRNASDTGYGTLKVDELVIVSGSSTIVTASERFIGDTELVLNAGITAAAQNVDADFAVDRLATTTAITNALSNGAPNLIRITDTAHGYATNDWVYIAGVGGVTAANNVTVGTPLNPRWQITVIDANTFDLIGSVFSGTYTAATGTAARDLSARINWSESGQRFKAVVGPYSAPTTSFIMAQKLASLIGDGISSSFTITHNMNSQDLVVSIRDTTSNSVVLADVSMPSVNTVTVTFAAVQALNSKSVTIIG